MKWLAIVVLASAVLNAGVEVFAQFSREERILQMTITCSGSGYGYEGDGVTTYYYSEASTPFLRSSWDDQSVEGFLDKLEADFERHIESRYPGRPGRRLYVSCGDGELREGAIERSIERQRRMDRRRGRVRNNYVRTGWTPDLSSLDDSVSGEWVPGYCTIGSSVGYVYYSDDFRVGAWTLSSISDSDFQYVSVREYRSFLQSLGYDNLIDDGFCERGYDHSKEQDMREDREDGWVPVVTPGFREWVVERQPSFDR